MVKIQDFIKFKVKAVDLQDIEILDNQVDLVVVAVMTIQLFL